MSAQLARAVRKCDRIPVPRCGEGISHSVLVDVLACYAYAADDTGHVPNGISLKALCKSTRGKSPATIRRAQAYLTATGWLKKVAIGGGARRTHYRVSTKRLLKNWPPTRLTGKRPPSRHETGAYQRKFLSGSTGPKVLPYTPPTNGASPQAGEDECTHGFTTACLADGTPKCPSCRSQLNSSRGGDHLVQPATEPRNGSAARNRQAGRVHRAHRRGRRARR